MTMQTCLIIAVLAAVAVFVVSSLVHMVFKWHNSEYKVLPNEDEVRAVLAPGKVPPGQYMVPHCADMKAMQSEEHMRKFREGPIGMLVLRAPCEPSMGKPLLQWFLLNLLIAGISASCASHLFEPGHGAAAAHLAAMIAFFSYGTGQIQEGIWMGKPWSSVAKYLLDALLYAAATAAVFYFMWP